MKAKYRPAMVTVQGFLRTEFTYGPPNYGDSPQQDSVERPIILTLVEPLDVEPNPPTGEEGDYYSHGVTGIAELHVAPVERSESFSWEACLGAVVEITGVLDPASTGHHHRPLLLFCSENDIKIVRHVGLDAVDGAEIFIRGSGVVLNRAGLILTAQHVARGQALSVRRRLQRVEARVIANHPSYDISLLQADIPVEEQPSMRRYTPPMLGEPIYACGFPLRPFLGHGLAITSGLISSLHSPFPECIHISAPIQFGNSGGPVFDSFGNILGIVCAKTSPVKMMNKVGSPAGDRVELLNLATATIVLDDFLTSNGVEVNDGPFWHMLPEPPPNASVLVGRLAERVCVEVEGWRAR